MIPIIEEPARSDRSTCRKCKRKIPIRELRVGVKTSHPDYGDYYLWYHRNCYNIMRKKDTMKKGDVVVSSSDISFSDESKIPQAQLLTAKSVLDAITSTYYSDAAEKIASKRADVQIKQEAFIPGMVAYHVFSYKAYLLIELQKNNIWRVEDENGFQSMLCAPILTLTYPGRFNRFKVSISSFLDKVFYNLGKFATVSYVVIASFGKGFFKKELDRKK